MKKNKLSKQFYIIFTVVIGFTSLFFTLGMNYIFEEFRIGQNIQQLESYGKNLSQIITNYEQTIDSEFNGFFLYKNNGSIDSNKYEMIESYFTQEELLEIILDEDPVNKIENKNVNNFYFYFFSQEEFRLLVFTDNSYLENLGVSFNSILIISFISLVLLGNTLILIWSRIILDRISKLQLEVGSFSSNNYSIPIKIEGKDEISNLSKTIEEMRKEIFTNEKTKQEILQNVSHDFKTPIAVIQSYAEAIKDGISKPSDAEVIINQSKALDKKVRQLLELTKLEYKITKQNRVPIKIKEILKHVIDQNKYRNNKIRIETNLDETIYDGVYDSFVTSFSNIIDNMFRYARRKISITLKKGILIFYNDGEKINESIRKNIFKPFHKGPKGSFGLGLSIVKRTMDLFNLELTVKNEEVGVSFIIKPLTKVDE